MNREHAQRPSETGNDPLTAIFLAGDALRFAPEGGPRLYGSVCRDCEAPAFPPTALCSSCLSENVTDLELSTAGRLYTFSTVHIAPPGWTVPYVVGYVDLPEGVRVFTHVVNADPDLLKMDEQVRLTTAILGSGTDGTAIRSYAFEPVDA